MVHHRSWGFALALVPAVALAGAGKDDAKSSSFWPDAPRPVGNGGPRSLRYTPDNIKGYAVAIDVATVPGSKLAITAKMNLELVFKPGKAPRSRDALLRRIALDLDAAGENMMMRYDGQQLAIRSGRGPATTLKRGDPGPLSVAAIADNPFTTLEFTEANAVELHSNPDNPFVAFGGDMLDTALVLFPDLPKQPVAPGHRWTMRRNVAVSQGAGRVDVTYRFEYLGNSACPSGAPACAQIALTASSKPVTTVSKGIKLRLGYGFVGKVFFDLDKGSLDESRIRMDMDIKSDGVDLTLQGTFAVKPV